MAPCPHCNGTGNVPTTWYVNHVTYAWPSVIINTDWSWFGYESGAKHGANGQGNWGWRHFKGMLMDAIEFVALPNGETFTLDCNLVAACLTLRGGFTNATITAFEVPVPLVSGWRQRLYGKVVTREQYKRALEGRFVFGQKRQ